MEVRASWESYLHEFRAAFNVVYNTNASSPWRPSCTKLLLGQVHRLSISRDHSEALCHQPLSHFENKYVKVEQPLFRLCIETCSGKAMEKCAAPRICQEISALR